MAKFYVSIYSVITTQTQRRATGESSSPSMSELHADAEAELIAAICGREEMKGFTSHCFSQAAANRKLKGQEVRGATAAGSSTAKVCHHFELKSRDIIFLPWTSRIPLKSKRKGRDPHVCALKSSDAAPPSPPAHHPKVWLWEPPCREVILSCSAGGDWLQWRLSAEHFSSQADHLRIAWNCQQCCTSAPEGLVQSI